MADYKSRIARILQDANTHHVPDPSVTEGYAGEGPDQRFINQDVQYLGNIEAEYLGRNYELAPERDEWKDLPELTLLGVNKTDFRDNEKEKDPALQLFRISIKATVDLGAATFQGMQTTVSRRHLGSLFLLAYNLRTSIDDEDQYLFNEEDIFRKDKDISYSTLNDQNLLVNVGAPPYLGLSNNDSANSCAFCFMATALLRMFTRNEDNFKLAIDHIKKGFNIFYGIPFPISDLTIAYDVLKIIHRQFSRDEIFKTTLYRLLYISNGDDRYLSLKRFLYDIHLPHTGMHILPLVTRLCVALNCNTSIFFKAIYTPACEKQISALVTAMGYLKTDSVEHQRRMWKYGRIFDPMFMSVLQTRTCPKLVMILAYMLKLEKPKGAEGILGIKQLEDVNPEDKRKCELTARHLLKMIKRTNLP